MYVDGTAIFGTGASANGTITVNSLSTIAVGTHTIYAIYNIPNGTKSTSPNVSFTVTTNTLPKPGITLKVVPVFPVVGIPVKMDFTLSCGTSCGAGSGILLIDNTYAGTISLGANGVATLRTTATGTPWTFGKHTAIFQFTGNPKYSNVNSPAASFQVLPPYAQQPVSVAVSIPASPFPQGETVDVNIATSCASNCGQEEIFVDGVPTFGTGAGANGTITVGALSNIVVGNHTILAAYGPVYGLTTAISPSTSFSVIANTLPAENLWLFRPKSLDLYPTAVTRWYPI